MTFGKKEYPRPSSEFYVNDFAGALLPGSRDIFFSEGDRLYELTKDDDLGGAQVVVTTILADNEEEADSIDKTKLFRQWQIGENDMGLLILLIFLPSGDEMVLHSTQIEIGYRMESYITAIKAGQLIDNCLYNDEWNGSLDMGLGEMYYEFLKIIYVDAYGYDSFDYDMEDYRYYILEYEDYDDTSMASLGLVAYIFSPYSSWSSKIFATIAVVLMGSGGGAFVFRRGKGGSSGGYGVNR